MIHIYIPSETSTVHNFLEISLWQTINNEIKKFKLLWPILAVGDWNARLGDLKDDLHLEEFNKPGHRVAKIIDDEYNHFGLELIQTCYKQR